MKALFPTLLSKRQAICTAVFLFCVSLTAIAQLPADSISTQHLVKRAAKDEQALKQVMDKETLTSTESFARDKSARDLQEAAVTSWYNNQPEAALLLNLKSAQKTPRDLNGWNNLGAMLTMSGLANSALPYLRHCLQRLPANPDVLNNIAQAYQQTGETVKAKQYFNECLAQDALHPEANHSMAMISMMSGDNENAAKYFEKEMEAAMRSSSLAQLVRTGKRDRINLAELRRRKMQREGIPQKDFFSEINLNQFVIPELPLRSEHSAQWQLQADQFMQSVNAEYQFWISAGEMTTAQKTSAVHYNPGYFSAMAEELLIDLDKTYHPLLTILKENDITEMANRQRDYYQKLFSITCPEAEGDAAYNQDVIRAYQKKCCDLKKPVTDAYMGAHNGMVGRQIALVQARWKTYINAMISIVQLDPSAGNKKKVYTMFAQYFAFLSSAVGMAATEDLPGECGDTLTSAQADSIILASKHDFDIDCPAWLKIKIPLKVAKISMDCQAFYIEADLYKLLKVGAEKSFTTGNSTLYIGASTKEKLGGVSIDLSQRFYVVFDNNNTFSDAGMKGSGKGELAGGMLGAEMEYDFSINSGFSGKHSFKNGFAEKFQKAMSVIN